MRHVWVAHTFSRQPTEFLFDILVSFIYDCIFQVLHCQPITPTRIFVHHVKWLVHQYDLGRSRLEVLPHESSVASCIIAWLIWSNGHRSLHVTIQSPKSLFDPRNWIDNNLSVTNVLHSCNFLTSFYLGITWHHDPCKQDHRLQMRISRSFDLWSNF